ncbi:MAG: 50S ribosomal protein L30 [bacterium]|nr:50S ribosomal protein L30 [bacterium]
MAKKLKITKIHSTIKRKEDQKRTMKALGLRRMNQTVVQPDVPAVRGMIFRVRHLLKVEEVDSSSSN